MRDAKKEMRHEIGVEQEREWRAHFVWRSTKDLCPTHLLSVSLTRLTLASGCRSTWMTRCPLQTLGFSLASAGQSAPVGSMTDWLVQGPALPEPNTRDDGDDVH